MLDTTKQNFVHAKDIDLTRGFAWDESNKKLWVDLKGLIDSSTLIIDTQTDKLKFNTDTLDRVITELTNKVSANEARIINTEKEFNRRETSNLENLRNTLETLKASLLKANSDYTDGEIVKAKEALTTAINAVRDATFKGVALGSSSGLSGNGAPSTPLELNLNIGTSLQGNGKDTPLGVSDALIGKVNQIEEAVRTIKNKPELPDTIVADISNIKGSLNELQNDINILKRPCSVAIRSVTDGGTVEQSDGYLFVNGGTVKVPATLSVGFQCTVVQTGTTEVTIKGENADVIAPYAGSLTLAGANAAVVLVHVEQGKFRLFGQTK